MEKKNSPKQYESLMYTWLKHILFISKNLQESLLSVSIELQNDETEHLFCLNLTLT